MERRWRTSKYFNPRSREGSDFFRDPFTFPSSNFNPRSREGSDSLLAFSAAFSSYFNPRSREGSDRANIGSNTRRTEFQSTLPRGERRLANVWRWRSVRYFNPRSREGSDHGQLHCGSTEDISIHAPARGATTPLYGVENYHVISIHAPARGATISCAEPFRIKIISIHAPARGATDCCFYTLDNLRHFNPRSREGSDLLSIFVCSLQLISIHAPARGATENLSRL